jgi:thiamine biosynthesis lipoprotein
LSGRAKLALPLCVLALTALTVYRLQCAPSAAPYYEFSGAAMGTAWSVKLAEASLDAEARSRIAGEIERRLEEVETLMSTWRAESELSRFNRHRSTEPFAVSPQTLAVFRAAREVSDLSGGAFDVTVAPLVAAWGFGATDRLPEPPAEEELAALRERVGYWKIELDGEAGTLRKTEPDTTCDLSAIAKGYGVDRVAEALVQLGYEHFLVEVGGELRARGYKRDGSGWRVAIERPEAGATRSIYEVIELRDTAVATSGDYRNYYEVDGERVSHTIDPRRGAPIRHGVASVSVLHPDAVRADALATALNVLGLQRGLAVAEQHGLGALFIVREPEGGFRSIATAPFGAVLDAAKEPAAEAAQ